MLSLLTKIASGYWHVADSQSGYTAITVEALRVLQLDRLYPRYGFPNHLLVELNNYDFRVRDVPIQPVYNVGEVSGIRLPKVVPTLSWLLVKCYFWRMKEKYIIRDFHPLVFFLTMGLMLTGAGIPARRCILVYLRSVRGAPVADRGHLRRLLPDHGHADALLRHVDGHGAQQDAALTARRSLHGHAKEGRGGSTGGGPARLRLLGPQPRPQPVPAGSAAAGVRHPAAQALDEVRAAYPGVRTSAAGDLRVQGPSRAGGRDRRARRPQHYALAKQALLAGKDVFVEKPLALTLPRGAGAGGARARAHGAS